MQNSEANTLTLNDVLRSIRADRYRVPGFQREFEWEAEDIRQLMRSLFNGYYIGSLLLWRETEAAVTMLDGRAIYGLAQVDPAASPIDPSSRQAREYMIVLDGQQRLTAMHYAFFGPARPLPGSNSGKAIQFFIDVETFMRDDSSDPGKNAAFICREEPESSVVDESGATDVALQFDDNGALEFPLRLFGSRQQGVWIRSCSLFWQSKEDEYREEAEKFKEDQIVKETERDALGDEIQRIAQSANNPVNLADLQIREAETSLKNAQLQDQKLEDELNLAKEEEEDALAQVKDAKGHQGGSDLGRELHRARLRTNQVREKQEEAKIVTREAEEALRRARSEREMAVKELDVDQESRGQDIARKEEEMITAAEKHREMTVLADEAARKLLLLEEFEAHIGDLLGSYRVPATVLTFETDWEGAEVGGEEDKIARIVSDAFTQLNRRGRVLRDFDLLNANLSLLGIPLRSQVEELRVRLSKEGLWSGRSLDDLVRMMLIRVHPEAQYILSEENYEMLVPMRAVRVGNRNLVVVKDRAFFSTNWDAVVADYERGVRVLMAMGSEGGRRPRSLGEVVPYDAMVPVFCSLWALTVSESDERKVWQWYWGSVFTQRYASNRPGTGNARLGSIDYREASEWLRGGEAPTAVQAFLGEFDGESALTERAWVFRSPEMNRPTLALMASVGPRSWATGAAVDQGEFVQQLIVTEEWSEDVGVPSDVARSVFNRVLVDPVTARLIGDEGFRAFLKGLWESGSIPPEWDEIAETHCIELDALELLVGDVFGERELRQVLRMRERSFVSQVVGRIFGEAAR